MFSLFRWWQFGQNRIVRRRRHQRPTAARRAHLVERLEDRSLLSTVPVDDGISLQTAVADKLENYDYPGEYAQRFDGVNPSSGKSFEVTFATQTTGGTYAIMVGPDVQDLTSLPTEDGNAAPFLRFKFDTVFTTKIDWSGPGDEGPEESITFVYGKLGVEYGNANYSSYRFVFPAQPGSDGQNYKPLFAFFIVDLDSRINVNVHGNALTSDGDHSSDQGWGPWEVSLAVHTVDWIDEDTYGTNPLAVDPNNPNLEISFASVWAGIVGPEELAVIVVATGPGAGPHVKLDDRVLSNVISFEVKVFNSYQGFAGGVFVAAGDVNADGIPDIIVGAGAGAPGGHVKVFSGNTSVLMSSFLAYPAGFSGGVVVAAGDVNGDGGDEIVSAPGSGSLPVRAFDGGSLEALDAIFAAEAHTATGLFIASSR